MRFDAATTFPSTAGFVLTRGLQERAKYGIDGDTYRDGIRSSR